MILTSASYILYGIKNCDTIKKARQWLDNHHIIYQFHDYRTDGISIELLEILIQYFRLRSLDQ